MNGLYLQVLITTRKLADKFTAFYEKHGLSVAIISAGHGTASSDILDYFGLEGTEKSLLFYVLPGEKWKALKRDLRLTMKLDIPGVGIAFLVPLSSIGGKKALSYLISGQTFQQEEESTLKDTRLELLVVIANQGHTERIMEAARKVQATGGTVIHARGTGTHLAEKFMGVTLVPEKDMLFIVVRKEQKNDVMRAIMTETGPSTPAGAIVFSLPVTDTAGMPMMEEMETPAL